MPTGKCPGRKRGYPHRLLRLSWKDKGNESPPARRQEKRKRDETDELPVALGRRRDTASDRNLVSKQSNRKPKKVGFRRQNSLPAAEDAAAPSYLSYLDTRVLEFLGERGPVQAVKR